MKSACWRYLQGSHAGKMMKRLGLVILCCFLLSGCITDPVFDTSSWTAYQRSLAAIKAKLSNDDLRRLEVALRYLLTESMPGFKIDGQVLETPSGSVEAARGNLSNSYLVIARLGPRINAKRECGRYRQPRSETKGTRSVAINVAGRAVGRRCGRIRPFPPKTSR